MANASYLRLTKSETRDLADRAYRVELFERDEDAPMMRNGVFFTAFVVIAALVTLFALIVR